MEFRDAVEIILDMEDGLVDNPKDPGGITNFGISKKSYPDLDIKNLTKEKAIEIYRKDFWEKISAESMLPFLRLVAFDCAVNQGPAFAIRTYLLVCDLDPNSNPGPWSLDTFSKVNNTFLLQKYIMERLKRYGINPQFGAFGEGWTTRLFDILFLSLKGIK